MNEAINPDPVVVSGQMYVESLQTDAGEMMIPYDHRFTAEAFRVRGALPTDRFVSMVHESK